MKRASTILVCGGSHVVGTFGVEGAMHASRPLVTVRLGPTDSPFQGLVRNENLECSTHTAAELVLHAGVCLFLHFFARTR